MNDETRIGDRTGCGCMVAIGLAAVVLIVLMTLVVLAGSELIVACCRACR